MPLISDAASALALGLFFSVPADALPPLEKIVVVDGGMRALVSAAMRLRSDELSKTLFCSPLANAHNVVSCRKVTENWGMYNISASTHELPPNAGVAGSAFGAQVFNDFFLGEQYDGPCPPRTVAPVVHHYVFTVNALDIELNLPGSPNFPPAAETLYPALITAGRPRSRGCTRAHPRTDPARR